jgi:UDP-N-acetylmuramoyl-tripeptide--D-alanyl-D-alanine ligase
MATPIPQNDAAFEVAEVLEATGGTLHGAADRALSGVCTDSRRVRAGEIFVALGGESFDGHDHLGAAAARGAALAIVERDVPRVMPVVRVESTVAALGALAAAHLRRWRKADASRRVVAITGSAGKTTTKTAITGLLEAIAPGVVHAAPGNLNNLVGVPAVIFGLGDRHRCAVLELGTNRPGEIAALARMTSPDVGVVTLIAAAHTEGLGSIAAVAREKTSLYAGLAPNGVAVGNVDDARVSAALASTVHGYGFAATAGYRIDVSTMTREARQSVVVLRGPGELSFETALLGRAGALACAGAIAAVEALLGQPLGEELVASAMASLEPEAGRLAVRWAPGGACVLDDSYNANPASMTASIEAARELAAVLARPLVLVLGEMRELGAQSAAAHEEIGRIALQSHARLLVTVSGEAELYGRAAGMRAIHAVDSRAAADVVIREVAANDLVLVKGSRGVRTELVVDRLLAAEVAP